MIFCFILIAGGSPGNNKKPYQRRSLKIISGGNYSNI